MKDNSQMITLSQVLNRIREKGFDNPIEMNENNEMICENLGKIYNPEDLLIIKNFRYEGESNPDDNTIVLIVEDKDGDIGYILDSYGAYRNHDGPEFDDFIKKIATNEREDEELFG